MDNKKNNVILLIVIPEYLRNEQVQKRLPTKLFIVPKSAAC